MAYDYLGLVNDVNRRLNEVELTSSNFANATGEYSMIKQSIINNLISEESIIESLMSFKRAGASAIVSYFALDIAKKL